MSSEGCSRMVDQRGRGSWPRGLVPLLGRRARRGRAGRRAGAPAPARGRHAGRRGGRLPGPDHVLVAARAGLRRLRDPVLDRPHAAVRAHGPRTRAARADPRGRPAGTADDLLAYLRTPGLLPGAGIRRHPRGRGPPRGRPAAPRTPVRAGSATAGRSRSSTGSRAPATWFLRRRAREPPGHPVCRPVQAHRHRPERPAARGGARVRQGAGGARRAACRARHDGPPIPRTCCA